MELADIFRAHGHVFRAGHRLCGVQHRAMRAIEACRTVALGGHIAECDHCGAIHYTYHACRNRHCPKCQTQATERWLAARCRELLPVPYFHLVFTLPHTLNPLAQGSPRVIYALLFQAVAQTLLEFGANPRWLGGKIGATLVLHTGGQTLTQPVHLHARVTGGALAVDGQWCAPRRGFLFPVKALSKVFCAKMLAGLANAFASHSLELTGATATLAAPTAQQTLLRTLRVQPWVVFAKSPMAGPAQVLEYLSRYTHRVALSHERLVAASADSVQFRYKDDAHGGHRRVMTLMPEEFIRRFLLPVLPRGFVRIRHYGLTSSRDKQTRLDRCRQALDQPVLPQPNPELQETLVDFGRRVAARDIERCPACHHGQLRWVATLIPYRPFARGPPLDSG